MSQFSIYFRLRPYLKCDLLLEHSDSGINNSIRFNSIRQFDKTDASTLIVTHTVAYLRGGGPCARAPPFGRTAVIF